MGSGPWHHLSMISRLSSAPDWAIVLGAVFLLSAPSNAVVRRIFLAIRLHDVSEGLEGFKGILKRWWGVIRGGSPSGVARERRGAGRWIGSLERVVIMTMVLASQPAAAGLVVAAKSILRFPEINADMKEGAPRGAITAEYVLVGSLASWLLGFGISFAAKALIDRV